MGPRLDPDQLTTTVEITAYKPTIGHSVSHTHHYGGLNMSIINGILLPHAQSSINPAIFCMSSLPKSPSYDPNGLSGSSSYDTKHFKRTYVACLNCRVRKVKCDLGDASSPRDRCVRCARERRDCVFVDSKKRKLAKVRPGVTGDQVRSQRPTPSPQSDTAGNSVSVGSDGERARGPRDPESTPKHFSTMEGALVFLANAAGKIASADERDNIDAREKHNQLENSAATYTDRHQPHQHRHQSHDKNYLNHPHSDNHNNQFNHHHNHDVTRAHVPENTTVSDFSGPPRHVKSLHVSQPSLNPNVTPGLVPVTQNSAIDSHGMKFTTNASTGSDSRSTLGSSVAGTPSLHGTPSADGTPPAYLRSSIPSYVRRPLNESDRLMMPPAENSYSARPESTGALSEIEYIGEHGILKAEEAEYLIEMFFLTMHPFFPHIPKFLHTPKALSGYPILLCAILTISSRYHALESPGHAVIAKNIEIHDRLWLYVQRLISQTVWAEASTRSIGTVFAFLLFTEWNPRAIHWRWSDYANRAEDASENKDPEAITGTSEPAGLGAMRRSYRMAWMLIGSAVRLAQDTGFMELSSKTFLATHVAEINSVMNMKRRSMLSHSLAELDMDTEDISEAEMETREDNEIKVLGSSEDMNFPENSLQFTEAQKAQIELLQITSVGHESLYGYKAQLGSLSQRQNLSILNFMNPMINSWSRKYKKFLVPSKPKLARKVNQESLRGCDPKTAQALASGIENESFIFEFNYTKLYIYSLALSPSPKSNEGSKSGKVSLKLDEISKSAKYIEQAFNAANEILQVAHRVHKLKMLRFMPVRWVTRIVRAVAFMVKCYLTITAHKTSEVTTDPSSNMDHFDATILSLSLISVEEIVQSIQKAAITLRDCSPDELHLCTRYSNVLLYLYSEMKTTLKNYSAGGDDVEDTGDKENHQHGANEEDEAETSHHGTEKTTYGDGLKEFPDAGFSGDSEMIDWFINNRNIGLDFVGPWTELIEQQIEGQNLNMDQQLNFG
ncbi:hypothetical protein JCM33374_g3269 [Metschnikowia sp. JCM 33374]|nr:hypothetical protein JCM33374_g3269 [Metschnikowia sp. JCM 33374]